MVSATPRLLFHVRNRRGLGHMMRGLNIAQAVRQLRPDAAVSFHLRAAPAPGLWPEGIDQVVDDGSGALALATSLAPDVQIFDTLLPDVAELKALRSAGRSTCTRSGPTSDTRSTGCASRLAFVMRRCLPDEQSALFEHPALAEMDIVLVPHSRDEFGYELPAWLAGRCHFVGAIARQPDAAARLALKRRLGLNDGEFLLTSTVGGGGFAEQARSFFDSISAVHHRLMDSQPAVPLQRLAATPGNQSPGCADQHPTAISAHRPLRHLVVLGPNFSGSFEPLPGMDVLACEPDLVNLLAASDLVIAEGGYNTVTELGMTRTPAVFLPSRRGKDDQFERVRRLADAGCALMFDAAAVADISAAVQALRRQPQQLAAMRAAWPAAPTTLGNHAAAECLLALAGANKPGHSRPSHRSASLDGVAPQWQPHAEAQA